MYVFTFFRDFALAMHLAISDDLIHWKELNAQEPIVESQVGERYMRDPFIIKGKDGVFHMLWTDGWGSQDIVYTSSKNLIDWTEQQVIPVMRDFPSAKNAWAPEACYDVQRDEYRIFWSSTVEDDFPEDKDKPKDYRNHRIYSCTTKDFKLFSPSSKYFDPGYNVIDASINFHDGTYVMAFKDERGNNTYVPEEKAHKYIFVATSQDLAGPWKINSEPVSKILMSETEGNDKKLWTEGPCVFWNGKNQEWWIFCEYFRNHQYSAFLSKDLIQWQNIDDQLQFPPGSKHGTIFSVEDSEIISGLEKICLPIDEDNY
jgi:sucrose-6-phosphate hydrolase SacC (GH32 family)